MNFIESTASAPAAPPTKPKNKVTLSASSVKGFLDCSYLFYQTRFLKVPDWTWPATKLGSLAHIILECLQNRRHRKHHASVMAVRSAYASAAIARLIKIYCYHNPDLDAKTLADLDKCLMVALDYDFFDEGAVKTLPPEHPFEIDYGDFQIKGFMDKVAFYGNESPTGQFSVLRSAIIRDFKSQKRPFSEEEMAWNIQSVFYQLAIRHEFKLPAAVEFILLRHGPTKRTPDKQFVQRVEPLSDSQLDGFIEYLREVNRAINALDEKSALDNPKCKKDEGFCMRVCSLKDPFDYWTITGKDGKVRTARISRHLKDAGLTEDEILEDVRRQLKPMEGEELVKKRYSGCFFWYNPETERPRNPN